MSSITLFVTHNHLTSLRAETKFKPTMTIAAIKEKLYMMTGTPPESQLLELRSAEGNTVSELTDDAATLESTPAEPLMDLHVTDTSAGSLLAELEDVSQVEKKTVDENLYRERRDEIRKMMAERRREAVPDDFQEAEAASLTVGSRCRTTTNGATGTIRFVGKIPEIKPGFWVFVELDEPSGKNDGSVKGRRFFTCEANHGAVMRPKAVELLDAASSGGAAGGALPASAAAADEDEDEI